jgi:hypothetical protein
MMHPADSVSLIFRNYIIYENEDADFTGSIFVVIQSWLFAMNHYHTFDTIKYHQFK